ncbi:MAG: hypothetical protein IPI65_16925 [Bacteroidetes bacterium]|nr:hypothetical protein [Bacteroidota bacterium]
MFSICGEQLINTLLKDKIEVLELESLSKGLYIINLYSENEFIGNVKVIKI